MNKSNVEKRKWSNAEERKMKVCQMLIDVKEGQDDVLQTTGNVAPTGDFLQ